MQRLIIFAIALLIVQPASSENPNCDFQDPQKRVEGGYPGITKEECVANGHCFDDTIPDVIWCFRENKGQSRNPACDFSNPEQRVDGGWPQIGKLECEALGNCFDDTIPDVVWCIKSNEKVDSSFCDFQNPENRVEGGYPGITREECVAEGNCFDDTTPDTIWCFKGKSQDPASDTSSTTEPSLANSENPNCDFQDPQKRVEGGYPGITKEECVANGHCFDDTIPDVIWCFRENKGQSRNPACDFSNPEQRVDGGWPQIGKLECEALGNCFDDTIPDVVWCIKSNEKVDSSFCDFQNPENRVEGGYPGITREECVAEGNCFDDTTPDTIWCFKGKSQDPASDTSSTTEPSLANSENPNCDFQDPQKRVEGGYPGITKEECVANGHCFDDTIPDVIWCFRENKGQSRNPACDFSNPEQRVDGGWPQIGKLECEALGNCFDDTIPDVVWCIKSNEKVDSSFCDFQNPENRVEGGYPGITREECVAEGNCFDDTTPDTIWCFKGKSQDPASDTSSTTEPSLANSENPNCDFQDPQKRVEGGYPGITKEECVANGHCFDDTIPDVIWCFRENKGQSRNPACDFSNPEQRVDGGWPQIGKLECEALGNCFDDTIPDVVWCIKSNEKVDSSFCDFQNPENRVEGGYPGITREECVAEGNCFDDTTPDTIWCFKGKSQDPASDTSSTTEPSLANSENPNCDFQDPQKRVEGGYPGITKEECVANGHCFDDTIPDVIWCFRENKGQSRNPACDFSNPEQRVDGGWPQIGKLECEALGNCFDDTIPDVVWCIKSNEKVDSSFCDFQNPENRVEGGYPGITREECVAEGNCFDDTTPDTIWCFKGKSQDPASDTSSTTEPSLANSENPNCDFQDPQKRVEGGYPGITKEECVANGHCFDDTIPDVIWCFRENKGQSRNPACDFSNPEQRVDGGWPQIGKLECEALGNCFDDTIPDVVWCIKSNEKVDSSFCDFQNPENRVEGGYPGITREECVAEGNCFDDTTPDTIWCFKGKSQDPASDTSSTTEPSLANSENPNCDFQDPQKRVEGGYPGITKEECVANGHCFDDTIPDVIWCFRENKGQSRNPACDFSNPEQRVDGGWPQIGKLECEALGNCFDDTIPDVVWCIKSNEKVDSSFCDFQNPENRVEGGYPGITREECVAEGNCFDDTTPDTIWCFKGKSQDPASDTSSTTEPSLANSENPNCDFQDPQKRVEGGYPGITKEECVANGHCFDDTIPDVIWCFRENKGQSRNPACDFSSPEQRVDGGWPQIGKLECEALGNCFDDTIPDVVWCIQSNEKVDSSFCDFQNPENRVEGGYPGITREECVAEGNCFDDTTPDTIWCFKGKSQDPASDTSSTTEPSLANSENPNCDFQDPQKRVEGGYPGITKEECVANGHCFDDTIPDVIWCFRENKGQSRNPACDFSNPEQRVDGGWPQIGKLECEALGNCFDDTIPDVVWCIKSNEKVDSSFCDFQNPENRVEGGYPGITREECVAEGNCFDDTTPDTIWCFKGKSQDPASDTSSTTEPSLANSENPNCDFQDPQKRVEGGYPGITKEECVANGHCFDDTIPDVIWCFRENKGQSRNPACDFSNPEQRVDGGWPQIGKLECEALGNCFDDTIPDVVWCIKSNEKVDSSFCDFQNPENRVEGGYPGITREECVAEGNCFDDTTPDTIWCFKGKSQDPASDTSSTTEPSLICPLNEVYNECGSACPLTCDNYRNPQEFCTMQCVSGCQCKPDYVRNTDDGNCCLKSECPVKSEPTPEPTVCPLHEVFNECGSACPLTCDNYQSPTRFCVASCVAGCECEEGYVRNIEDGNCCLKSECPARVCGCGRKIHPRMRARGKTM